MQNNKWFFNYSQTSIPTLKYFYITPKQDKLFSDQQKIKPSPIDIKMKTSLKINKQIGKKDNLKHIRTNRPKKIKTKSTATKQETSKTNKGKKKQKSSSYYL